MASTQHAGRHQHTTAEMAQCIEDCLRCYRICLDEASHHCLIEGGPHVQPEHFRLMMGCAELCRTASHFMIAGVAAHEIVCRACAEICERCADSCERVGDMNECVDACRRCASSCQAMAGSTRDGDLATSGLGSSASDSRNLQG